MAHNLNFALFGNIYQAKKSANIQQILNCLKEHDAGIWIEKLFYDYLVSTEKIVAGSVNVFDGNDFNVDFVISMGGDGTLLRAATHVGSKQIPILGVNMGRLGFLAGIVPDEFESVIDSLYNNEYALESHSVIKIEADGKPVSVGDCALNDVAVLKRDTASMISINVNINGEYLTTYQADGLIISTPTGSTAYSLSNGGPIMVPRTNIFCLTPVAAHSLNVRPIVIPDSSEISLTVESRSHNFLVAVDGQSTTCAETTRINVSKAPYEVRIVKKAGQSYFSTLRQKMMWGADNRK
ncbi:MAG: NAD kinase [Prevotellaceae bacterium]|nr:NAD kinase [Prevotellaceae bacterium]